MNKLLLILMSISLAMAGGVRVASFDADGIPEEEIIDLSICLERTPTSVQETNYEEIIGFFADALYEMSNGGNYLGTIDIHTGERYCSSADIVWRITGEWPRANPAGFISNGIIFMSDDWGDGRDNFSDEGKRLNFGMTLAHESGHYLYGLLDDYTISQLPRDKYDYISVVADPVDDKIIVTDTRDQTKLSPEETEFRDRLSPFSSGTPVVFFEKSDLGPGKIPQGLSVSTIHDGENELFEHNYAIIDQVDDTVKGVYKFNLKDANELRIDIQDAGFGKWSFDLPAPNRNAVAHSIMSNQYAVAGSWTCSPDGYSGIQWQWANLSTEFNINQYSAQGIAFRKNGISTSGWDLVSRNPINDKIYGTSPDPNWRYWFKSLAKRKPTASDVFATKSFLMNYSPATGKVMDGYAVWQESASCGKEKNYNLPYMKVEIANQHPTQYRKLTRRYLNIQWDRPETEIIVLVDASPSMGIEDKLEKAKLAAKSIAEVYLSASPTYNNSNVSVGVYAFNDNVVQVRSLNTIQSKTDVETAIDSIAIAGSMTVLFNALYSAINDFSTNAVSKKILYVITDGINYTAGASSRTEEEVKALYRSRNVPIYALAYGANASRELLSSMAAETGGEYYEGETGMEHDVIASITNVLAAVPGNTQLKSATIAYAQNSDDINLPHRLQRARIYASYDIPSSSSTGSSSGSAGSPIELLTQGGASIPFFPTSNTIGNTVYFTAEVDSATLVSLPNSAFKVKNNLSGANVDFRVIATGEYQEHSMNVKIFPEGLFEWPVQKHFIASVRGLNGILADVDAIGKLVSPDGNVVNFTLRDDGLGGDLRAGDGLYYADMPPISKNGTYWWEISMSSPGGVAHTTRVGTSLPDSIPFTEVVDPNPFELVRNGQFMITGCCTDESNTNLVKLKPEKRVNAFLQSGLDTDRFEIEATLAGRSYSLRLSSNDLGSFDRVEVYYPSDLSTPVYSVNVLNNGFGSVSVPLSAEFAKSGNIVAIIGTNSSGANYSLDLLEQPFAEFSVGRFEVATDWHSQHTTLALDENRKSEGNTSLVTPAGWKTIESRNISTSDFDVIGERMSVDVLVPASTQNPYWIGTLELWLYVPSSNKRIQLGEQIQLDPYFGNWKSYEFRVPSRVKKVLSEQHHDARFQIVLNTADSLWIDNLRFVGKLTDNPVNQVEPECPQDNGCGSSTPIMLHVNESKRVVPEGDLWIEITGFPNDWTPAVVTLGIAPEDGIEMTGSMTYDNGTYPLSGWYMEKSFGFVRGKRYLVKLHNLGHRPYRVNAWVSGQAMGVASLGLPYNVELGVNW